MNDKKLYFGPLDTLRVYAFLIVYISHAYFSFFKVTDGRTKLLAHGEVGVHIFFALSAFLITYLSLREYAKQNTFSIAHFFKKRILRIWPVYFIVLIAAYIWHLIAAPEQAIGCAPMFTYFLGNFCLLIGLPDSVGTPAIIPMWSISIEQQFYVVFPLLFCLGIWLAKRMQKRFVKGISFAALIILFIYTLIVRYANAGNWEYISYTTVTSLPGFIAGICLAYAMHANAKIIQHIRTYRNFYMFTALAAFFATFYIKFLGSIGVALYILPAIYATLVYVILGTNSNQADKKEENTNTLQYLGRISYGLYAYHMFAIVFMQHLDLSVGPLIESLIALGMTVFLAHISYRYIEKWFLSFK
ncbi:MAG: acyltransferase [Patescibacteria group bacterium]